MEDDVKNFGESLIKAIEACRGSRETRQRNDRDRAYDGQPWTGNGIRGKTLVEGLTMRDIKDCFVKAWLQCHGPSPEYDAVHDGSWNENMVYSVPDTGVDPIAVAQCLTCEIEKMMGIYPNVPGLESQP